MGRDPYGSSIARELMKHKDFLTSAYGITIPWIIYGTACQSKHYNEAGVGDGVAACLRQGIDRAELYLQTKFTPLSGQDPARVPISVAIVL